MSSLPLLYDRELISRKTITNVLKKYLSQNVALEFTAIRPSGTKAIFKDTKMYKCMFGKNICKILKHFIAFLL